MSSFRLGIDYQPRGDQQAAIDALSRGLREGEPHQVLLGVTGSGKTFTMAKVIERMGLPALVLAHNKTLAAQLYQEFTTFFPSNAVEYFVSYYDYYQPEAYIPSGDVYIEKEATINDELDKLRLSATRSLFERRDCIIVASVSCIYGLGSPVHSSKTTIMIGASPAPKLVMVCGTPSSRMRKFSFFRTPVIRPPSRRSWRHVQRHDGHFNGNRHAAFLWLLLRRSRLWRRRRRVCLQG